MKTNWIETEIAKGLQGLLCLSLDRQPALELIEGTLRMWCKIVSRGRLFDEVRDAPRFQDAFLALGARKTWPVPADFIEALPPIREAPVKPIRIEDEAVRENRMRSLAELASKLAIPMTPKESDENP